MLVVAALAACEQSPRPAGPLAPEASLAVGGQGAEKIGADVLQALQRGEQPRVMIALAAAPSRDVGQLRRDVSAAQDAVLRGVGDDELRIKRRFVAVPALAGIARNRGVLQRLAADPRVLRIDLDGGGTGSLTNSVPHVRANFRHARGNRGSGATVAIIDSGIDTNHPDLADALTAQACFGDNDNAIDGVGFCPNGSDRQTGAGAAEDDAGHGTHVSGIVASNGSVSGTGMAPDAQLVAIKVLNNCAFSGCFFFFSEIVAALDYIIATPGLGVQVINMSLGTSALFTGACDNATASTMAGAAAVNTLRANGVITFASSGNNGSSTAMTLPACLTNVVSVAAADNGDVLANFSNTNATTDLIAPGVGILSLAIGGGTTTASGTSMASPHAAGCAALLIDAGDATTPAAIEARLKTSTVQVTDARNNVTLPRIDCSPPNTAPQVTVTDVSVTVAEGSTASNSGTFSDVDGDAVTLSASIGSLTTTASGWAWSFATTDGPAQSQTVTITGTDALGAATNATFSLVVQNVTPSVNAGSNSTVASNQSFAFSGSFSDAGVIDNPWSWKITWGDGSQNTGSTASQAAAITANHQFCGAANYTVTLYVTDKDGAEGSASRTVTVTYVPVTVDILQKSVNLGSKGMLPVAVLSTATFDATTLDPATIVLGDETGSDTPVAKRNNSRYFASAEDVNGDGRLDLVLQFSVPALVANGDLTSSTTSLVLRGFLADGCTNVRGSNTVVIVP
jgi:hypothetical protein